MGALDTKVAIVTGSTRGIGRGIAARFADEGAVVVVHGRSQDGAASVAEEIGRGALGLGADVSDSRAVDALVAHAVEAFGRVDVLVNNAGIALDNFVTRTTDERWAAVLGTNLSGPFYVTRAVVPHMKHNGGSIVNVVSWSGLRGNVGQSAYAASKAGLHGLTLALAKELAKFGIRVNALSPAAPTEIGVDMPAELRAKALRRTPLRRTGTVDEVAEGALFLASERSSFTTGQVLHVDGGLHLT